MDIQVDVQVVCEYKATQLLLHGYQHNRISWPMDSILMT